MVYTCFSRVLLRVFLVAELVVHGVLRHVHSLCDRGDYRLQNQKRRLRAIRPVVWRRSTTIQPIHPRLCLNRVSRSPGRRYCWLPDFLRRQFFSRDGECDGYDTARRHVIGLTIYFFALWVAASLAPFQGVRQRAQCSRLRAHPWLSYVVASRHRRLRSSSVLGVPGVVGVAGTPYRPIPSPYSILGVATRL
jgi:hypothetical protein